MKKNIKVGDRVVVTVKHMYNKADVGMKGIILEIDDSTVPYLIKLDGYDTKNESWCKDVELIDQLIELFPIY